MWQQQRTYRQPSQALESFFQRVLEGGDRAGLSIDAQKRTKTEWEYEDMCGGKKRASAQVRIQDQGGVGGSQRILGSTVAAAVEKRTETTCLAGRRSVTLSFLNAS